MVLEVIPEVEERLIGSIKVGSWLFLCCKKFYLGLEKYFHGVKDGFGSTLKGLNMGFGSNPIGYRDPNGFNKG